MYERKHIYKSKEHLDEWEDIQNLDFIVPCLGLEKLVTELWNTLHIPTNIGKVAVTFLTLKKMVVMGPKKSLVWSLY